MVGALLQSYGMPSAVHVTEFFVVGGPVDPERPCYVLRAADAALAAALRGQRLCCVLGPPAVGKTSLMLRAARALRAAGGRVAYVSLLATGGHDGEGPALGAEQVATRVAAALELPVDVAAWWHASETRLGEPRLVQFFAEVVLPAVSQPVFVLVDEVEMLLASPGRVELLDGIMACQARREHDPSFARLGFVLAGCAAPRQLFGGGERDAVAAGVEIVEPADFSTSEANRLAAAFGGEPAQAHALMERICAWTGGHPYFTQKVARGVTRKGGRLEDVERVVRAELLTPDAAESDAALAPMRARLLAATRTARRAAKVVRRLSTAASVRAPADAAVGDELRLSGAALTDEGRWRPRNRIVKELGAAGWFKPARRGFRWAAVAVGLLVALAGAGYWYARYLPEGDIATLTSPTAPVTAVEEAYTRLRALPGFAEQADTLWLAALLRQSAAARSLAEATAADQRLRVLPGQDATADRLLGEFWLRQARAARFAEQRAAALLYAQRAARLPAAGPAAAAELAELASDDYPLLRRSLRLPAAPASWRVAFAESTLSLFDAEQRLLRVPFGAAAGNATPARLTALQYGALERELNDVAQGLAGDFELAVNVAHPATGELTLTLAAPSGAAVTLTPPNTSGEAGETFVFQAVRGAPLRALADQRRAGTWRLTVVDRTGGNAGALLSWGLTFSETGPRDLPPAPLAIPDPARTEAVALALEGQRAAAWSTVSGPIGAVALWNLTTGVLEHDLGLPSAPRHVALNRSGTRVLVALDRELVLFDVASGAVAARVGTQTEFVLPPVFSADGAYVAIAERVDRAAPLYSVLRSSDASFVASFEGAGDVGRWELGPGARYAALVGPANVVRIVATRGGLELERLVHDADVASLAHLPDDVLVTVDVDGRIASWPLAATQALPRPLGRAVGPASVSVAPDAARLAYTRHDGAVAVIDTHSGAELVRLLEPRAVPPTVPQLAPDGAALVTQSDRRLRFWDLPTAAPVSAAAAAIPVPTAVAVDRTSDFAALGLASGQVEFGDATGRRDTLAFFGHRGAVTAVAVQGPLRLAATGGADGFVRLWDVASGAPTGVVVQPANEPITAVALASDGRYVASAAGSQVRVAGVVDGGVVAEFAAAARVTALALTPGAVAFGDESGALVLAPLAELGARSTARLAAAVRAVAFAPDARRVVLGGANGEVKLLRVDDGAELAALEFPSPVRFVDFSPDGSGLLVATDAWLHALALEPAATPLASRLAPLPARQAALAPVSATAVRIVGLDGAGGLVRGVLDLAVAPVAPPPAGLVDRDWSAVLEMGLDDSGVAVPLTP